MKTLMFRKILAGKQDSCGSRTPSFLYIDHWNARITMAQDLNGPNVPDLIQSMKRNNTVPYYIEVEVGVTLENKIKVTTVYRVSVDPKNKRFDLQYTEPDFNSPDLFLTRRHVLNPGDKNIYIGYACIKDSQSPGKGQVWRSNPGATSVAKHHIGILFPMGNVLGFDDDSFLEILERIPDQFSVRKATESIQGAQCYVVEGQTKFGNYTVWIDPASGFSIRQATLNRNDTHYMSNDKGCSYSDFYFKLDNTEYENIDNSFFLKKARREIFTIERGVKTRGFEEIETKKIEVNPDFAKHGAFSYDFIVPGSLIRLAEDGLTYEWQMGELKPLP